MATRLYFLRDKVFAFVLQIAIYAAEFVGLWYTIYAAEFLSFWECGLIITSEAKTQNKYIIFVDFHFGLPLVNWAGIDLFFVIVNVGFDILILLIYLCSTRILFFGFQYNIG